MSDLSDEIRAFCSQNHLRLNTNLGQHFLIDQEKLDAIISAATIQPDDHIVEIGPGIGVLTRELIQKADKVTAIEIDKRIPPLIQKFITSALVNQETSKLDVIESNALHTAMPEGQYKIVANIPYHITSPLLRHVYLESDVQPTSLTLLIQKEVAERICSEKDRSLLTILVQLFGTPKIITHVPPKCFLPPPKVDSAVIHIASHTEPLASRDDIDEIFKLTKIAFGQKRKMLSNSLGLLPNGMERLKKADIDPTRRPQTLSVKEWLKLSKVNF